MIYAILIVSIIFLDLYSKKIINEKMPFKHKVEVIQDKFYITHIKNEGGMLGFLQNKQNILHICSFLAISNYCYQFLKYNKIFSPIKRMGYVFVIGGGIANIAERLTKNSVTDFIYIKYKKLPIFNIADTFIFTGIIFLIFFNKNIEKN